MKNIEVTLVRGNPGLKEEFRDKYRITRITSAITISLHDNFGQKVLQVGDWLSEKEAEQLCINHQTTVKEG
jgi:hypothetical protein